MDWSDSPEQAAFRGQVRALVDEHLPDLYRRMRDEGTEEGYEGGWIADRASDDAERKGAAEAWTDAVSERGWFAPHWPEEYGGAGLSPMEQFIYNQEMAEAGAPIVGGSGVSLLGPTMIVHGTEEQKEKYLPDILSGETVWAQGYSEPGAGSDLGSLQTRAVPRRRRVRDQRPEDLDVERAPRRLDLRARPHQPGRAEAPRHQLHADGHGDPRHRGAPAGQRRLAALLERDVLRGRARAGQPGRRRDRPRLVRRHDAARLRALQHQRRGDASRRELGQTCSSTRAADEGADEGADAAVGALRAGRPLRRDRGGVQLRVPHHLDAERRA